MTETCDYCQALKWKSEPKGMCCNSGKIQLDPFKSLPEPLQSLLLSNHQDRKHFMDRIRNYNDCFSMTSFGGEQIRESGFSPTFKVRGQVYHRIGSLLPPAGKEPEFLQIYFVGDDENETRLRCGHYPGIRANLVSELQDMLHRVNSYIKDFQTTLDQVPDHLTTFKVVIDADKRPINTHPGRFNAPRTQEVALVIVGQQFKQRDIILHSRDNTFQRINELHRSYDALQYPLLFCYGEDGYYTNIPQRHPSTRLPLNTTVSAADFYAYRLMSRKNEVNHLLHSHALLSQFLVDMYAKIETERLNFIRFNQAKLRAEEYIHLKDAVCNTDADANQIGTMVVLPSSFTGSPRYMHERTQDAMTYVRRYGRPDLFITFTCNPRWEEIRDELLPGQKPHDRHDLIARVFHIKVKMMMKLLTKGCIFGPVNCYMYTIEWQKRGLPHAHILLWLENRIHPSKIDDVISAEFPDPRQDEKLYNIVKANMIHGPCGSLNRQSPCMVDDKCTKKYPKPLSKETQTAEDGYPSYRRRSPADGGFTTEIRHMEIDNRWVVPYNAVLLRTFDAHINVELCSSVKAIKYICKYINKGSDQATFGLQNEHDEITKYETGRYISSSEAVWRILKFSIHERYPTIVALAVHLENGQRVYFTADNILNRVRNPPMTTLLGFFVLCQSDDFAKTLLYVEVPSYYIWSKNKFVRRKTGKDVPEWPGVKKESALGRVYNIHPRNTECFHLRLLLHEIRGPTCFNDLKTVDGYLHPTFMAACKALGLLEDDKQWESTLQEASECRSAYKLRELFAVMLVFCQLSDPARLWNTFKNALCEDLVYQQQMAHLRLDDSPRANNDVENACLILLEDITLSLGGQHLKEYGMPCPNRLISISRNAQDFGEPEFDPETSAQEVESNEASLTEEQQSVYQQIVQSIQDGLGQIFFLDAPGGTGKTFLINTLLTKVRSENGIALAVASSGIAATLLKGGRTAHSAFKLPLNFTNSERPQCQISKQSNLANALRECKLIVWDECTMAHKSNLEALNNSLQDIRNCTEIMGGLTVLLAGDFRQTLPVVRRGTRADEIQACIKSSVLWPHLTKISLKTNMRVHLNGDASAGQFSALLLQLGEGRYSNINGVITVPPALAIKVSTLDDLTAQIYPDIQQMSLNSDDWLCERAILTPRNETASEINNKLLSAFDAHAMTYKAIDAVVDPNDAVHYPIEFLNSLHPSGFPEHNLQLKEGAPVILLRNLHPPKLCNGTRLRITKLRPNIIEATIMAGFAKGESVLIPRIPLISSEYSFDFKRIQFPLRTCFAMTINKSQGQSLKMAGIDLRAPCFSHGQLYVACSRVSSPENLVILSPNGQTQNVVYQEAIASNN